MADFFNHAITVGDVFAVAGLGLIAFMAWYAKALAVNMEWVR